MVTPLDPAVRFPEKVPLPERLSNAARGIRHVPFGRLLGEVTQDHHPDVGHLRSPSGEELHLHPFVASQRYDDRGGVVEVQACKGDHAAAGEEAERDDLEPFAAAEPARRSDRPG